MKHLKYHRRGAPAQWADGPEAPPGHTAGRTPETHEKTVAFAPDGAKIHVKDTDVFLITGVHRYAMERLTKTQDDATWVYPHAGLMRHLLVSLDEVLSALEELEDKKLLQPQNFWGVFPDLAPGRYKYSILVDRYDDKLIEELRGDHWINGMKDSLLKEVDHESPGLNKRQRADMILVEQYFGLWRTEWEDAELGEEDIEKLMITDWEFVTWDKRDEGARD